MSQQVRTLVEPLTGIFDVPEGWVLHSAIPFLAAPGRGYNVLVTLVREVEST